MTVYMYAKPVTTRSDRRTLMVKVPLHVGDRFDAVCAKHGMTKTEGMKKALNDFMKCYERKSA